MSDVSTVSEVTERTLKPGAFHPIPEQARSRPATNHWSQRLRDPLGKALQRLHGQRDILDLMESAAASSEPAAVISQPAPDAHDDSAAILPLQPVRLAAEAETTGGADRRRFPRRQSECSVALIERKQAAGLTPQQTDWLLQSTRSVGRLLDISQAGLCLLLDNDLEIGSEVLLRISNSQLNRQVDSTATVVRSQPSGPGRFSVHCVARREFTLDQLQDLGRPVMSGHVLA